MVALYILFNAFIQCASEYVQLRSDSHFSMGVSLENVDFSFSRL